MENENNNEARVSLVKHSMSVINAQWPHLKFYSLGFYCAWILLTMGGTGIVDTPPFPNDIDPNILLYLYSGVPLSIVLITCGLLHKQVEPYIVRGPLVPIMSALASLCTFFVVGGFGYGHSKLVFALASIGTGLGTAFLCLRLGYMYSTLASKRVLYITFSSGILGDLIYFTCTAIDMRLAAVFLSLLPILSMALALLREEKGYVDDEVDQVPASMLPRGFFARCILFVAVFSVAVGITKGISTLTIPASVLKEASSTSILATMVALTLLCAFFAVYGSIKRFDVSKIYYPVIIVAALGTLLAPLLGQSYLWLQVIIVNAAYNVFALALWCLFSNISGQTDMSSIHVFGLGRGASGLGTTLGQAVATLVVSVIPDLMLYTNEMCIAFAVVILLLAIFVLDERTVGDALEKTFREETAKTLEPKALSREKAWNAVCDKIASESGLTARERDVLSLLGHGRTASYIAEELGISYNTTKGHVRNLYAKCGVHSRQELLDLIETARD